MRVLLKNTNFDVEIEVNDNDHKDFFEKMSAIQEILAEKQCGKCGSEDLVFNVREVDGNKFYELRCRGKQKNGHDCRAVLSFGAHKKGGTLFPKRFEEENGERKWLPDNGWVRWDSKAGKKV